MRIAPALVERPKSDFSLSQNPLLAGQRVSGTFVRRPKGGRPWGSLASEHMKRHSRPRPPLVDAAGRRVRTMGGPASQGGEIPTTYSS